MRSAWIEIAQMSRLINLAVRRAPCGARGLKLRSLGIDVPAVSSRSMRSAWIEIGSGILALAGRPVALHAERVD